jgi:hypothetical protein
MKYCISGRQPMSTLRKADEIKMIYNDIERIIDYIVAFPDKTIIIDIPKNLLTVDWELLVKYSQGIDLILCLHDLSLVDECKERGLKFYWAYPITTYYELQGILKLEPCYLFLGAPLCFDLARVRGIYATEIRLVPNVAFDTYIPREDGICGQWIRPEDVKYYETYVSALEFTGVDLAAERTLLDIYKNDQTWPGNLSHIIRNLRCDVSNLALPEDIGKIRMTCGQRCMCNNTCHYCYTSMKYADKLHALYLKRREQKGEN